MILAALLLAATADLYVPEVTASKTAVQYGETFSFTARVTNLGPDAAEEVVVSLGGNTSSLLKSVTAPPGWSCQSTPRYALTLFCTAPSLAANAEAQFTMTLAAPQPSASTFRVGAGIGSSATDPRSRNNSLDQEIALVSPPRTAALHVTGSAASNPVAEGGDIRVIYDVRNGGPDDTGNLLVLLSAEVPFTATGAGWNCTGNTCTRAALRAGTSAPIELRATAPLQETDLDFVATLHAEQLYDSDTTPDSGHVRVSVGTAESWERLLVPVADSFVPGSGGARWTTEISALILADERPGFAPHPCEIINVTCFIGPAPLRRQIDAFEFLIVDDHPTGQYVFVRPQDAAKWRFNARIRDAAREEQTAGAEMPIVRDSEFRGDTIALLNIPVAPQYRHTLRIYDDLGRPRAGVRIRVYAGDETEPRVSVVRELVRSQSHTTTSALLQTYPAYAQLELGQLLPLAGLEPLRVEIEPLEPGVRLWGFISIVNNETHHVTVVTPQ